MLTGILVHWYRARAKVRDFVAPRMTWMGDERGAGSTAHKNGRSLWHI